MRGKLGAGTDVSERSVDGPAAAKPVVECEAGSACASSPPLGGERGEEADGSAAKLAPPISGKMGSWSSSSPPAAEALGQPFSPESV